LICFRSVVKRFLKILFRTLQHLATLSSSPQIF